MSREPSTLVLFNQRESRMVAFQVVGVFPGARMNDGTEEELDVDVELLNWEDSTATDPLKAPSFAHLCRINHVKSIGNPGCAIDTHGYAWIMISTLRLLLWCAQSKRKDCAQNLVARVDKTWRQLSSQKYRSILDLVSKKARREQTESSSKPLQADHSVLRLLQISQQHIESQLDRIRHERELWKEAEGSLNMMKLTWRSRHTVWMVF